MGEVAARVLLHPEKHSNQAYELTNAEQMDFAGMCAILSKGIGREIKFNSPNLLSFFLQKSKEGLPAAFILVMIMLHYLPRFQIAPITSDWTEKLLDRKPTTFAEFVEREKYLWEE